MASKEKLLNRAQKYIQKGSIDKALADYRAASDMDPKDVSVRLRIGDLCAKSGRKDEAIKEYSEVARDNTHRGFYLKAIAVYKQILKLNSTNLDVHYKLADLYTKQRLMADAIGEYSYIIGTFERTGKTNEVLDLLKKMTEIDPENVGIRLKLADLYRSKKFDHDAISEYEEIFTRLVSRGKLDRAEKIYQDTYRLYPKEPRVVKGLMELHQTRGDNGQFLKYARVLVGLYEDAGQVDEAKAVAKEILKVRPDDPAAVALAGWDAADETPNEAEFEVESAEIVEEKAPEAPAVEEAQVDFFNVQPTEDQHAAAEGAGAGAVEDAGAEEAEIEVEIEVGGLGETAAEEPEAINEIEEVVTDAPEVVAETVHEEPLEVAEEVPAEVVDEPEDAISEAISELMERIEPGKAAATAPAEAKVEEKKEEYVDLSAELGIEGFSEGSAFPMSSSRANTTFDEFKSGIESQLSREDTETHYNLGIAYMEMELYSEASKEFKVALKDPRLAFDCFSRLGVSAMSASKPEEAAEYYIKALKIKGRTGPERKGAMYELAVAYEAASRVEEAAEILRSIYKIDPEYREVASKVKELSGVKPNIPTDDDLVEVEIL